MEKTATVLVVDCDTTNNFNQWVQDEDGNYERPPGLSVDIDIGKNPLCTVREPGGLDTLSDTCENLQNNLNVHCADIFAMPSSIPATSTINPDNNKYDNCCSILKFKIIIINILLSL